jgi:D-amino-acid dehydrogenase
LACALHPRRQAAEVDRISAALHPLVSQSLAAHQTLASRCGAQSLIGQEGWLKVYGSQQEFETTALDRRLMDRFGVRYTILDRKALTDLEPNLDPSLCLVGLHQFESGFVRNPGALANAILKARRDWVPCICAGMSKALHADLKRAPQVHAEDGVRSFDRLVIAAGAWSANLVRQVGDRVSLDTERGYHIAFGEETGRLLRGPVVIPRLSLVLSPMHDGVRLVSGDELAG